MKNIIFIFLFSTLSYYSSSQEKTVDPIITKDAKGNIISAEFPNELALSKIPLTSNDFFKDFLKISKNDEFKKVPSKEKKKNFIHENYRQYYKGIKVENAGYTFHYQNGKMFYAHGIYVKVNDLDVIPTISAIEAKDCFAGFKLIPSDSITDFDSELVIKEIPFSEEKSSVLPKLVYRI